MNYDSGNVAVFTEQGPYVKTYIVRASQNFRPWTESEYLLENIGVRVTLKEFEGKTELSLFMTCRHMERNELPFETFWNWAVDGGT